MQRSEQDTDAFSTHRPALPLPAGQSSVRSRPSVL